MPNAHSCRAAFGGLTSPISENPVMAKFSFGEYLLPHTQLNKVYEGCCWAPRLKRPSMIVKGKPTISPSAKPSSLPGEGVPESTTNRYLFAARARRGAGVAKRRKRG